jgi:hypothetical protein
MCSGLSAAHFFCGRRNVVAYCIAMLLLVNVAHAQVNDAQVWENVNVEKQVRPKLSVRLIQEGRVTENFSRFSFNYFDTGLNFKLNKHFHGTVAYVWVEKQRLDDTWSARHQAYASITFKQKFGDLTFSDRQMVLWQVKDYFTSPTGGLPEYYLRNKVTLKYEKSFRFQPYVAEEIYYHINTGDAASVYHFNRLRCFAGLFYHPNIRNEFEIYYLYEKHFNEDNPPTNFVTGLGYAYSF